VIGFSSIPSITVIRAPALGISKEGLIKLLRFAVVGDIAALRLLISHFRRIEVDIFSTRVCQCLGECAIRQPVSVERRPIAPQPFRFMGKTLPRGRKPSLAIIFAGHRERTSWCNCSTVCTHAGSSLSGLGAAPNSFRGLVGGPRI
jgi:hypothetical protein